MNSFRHRLQNGFSLIEVMIVVAIIAILAAIALPSYNTYILKSRRADVEAFLMGLAATQQQWLMDNRSYNSTVSGAGGLVSSIPSNISSYFTIGASSVTSTTYTLTATATSGQAADKEGGQSCATLTLDQSGNKAPSSCWKR